MARSLRTVTKLLGPLALSNQGPSETVQNTCYRTGQIIYYLHATGSQIASRQIFHYPAQIQENDMSTRNQKPRIFIASAVESLDVADAVNVSLDHDAEVTVWKYGFEISSDNISSLLDRARASDFAVFIFTADDASSIRQQEKLVVRDNVLFELGLFVGSIGKDRCFIVKPRNADLHIPTDLLGLTPADYEANRSDNNLAAAVNAPCTLIRERVASLGMLTSEVHIATSPPHRKYSYPLGPPEQLLLMEIFEHSGFSPEGVAWHYVFNDKNKGQFDKLAALKLERLGLIKRKIVAYQDGKYYGVSLSADGQDYLLDNEQELRRNITSAGTTPDFDDDIPI